jgi:cytochrome c5
LNEHVFNHINTEIVRPIELVNGYNRAAQAVIEAANRGSGKDVYAQATAACERRGVPIASIAQCAAEYALEE